MNFAETFVENLASLKKANNLKNKDLAEIAGVTPTAIGDILKGKTDEPKLSIIVKLASFYKVSLDWLLLGQETSISKENDIHNLELQSEKNYKVKNNQGDLVVGENQVSYGETEMLRERIKNLETLLSEKTRMEEHLLGQIKFLQTQLDKKS